MSIYFARFARPYTPPYPTLAYPTPWLYCRRANFVYFGMKLNSAKGDREKEIIDYALQVLGESVCVF